MTEIKWYETAEKLARAVEEVFPYGADLPSAYDSRPLEFDVMDWGKDNSRSMGRFKIDHDIGKPDFPSMFSFDERADFLYNSIIGAFFKNEEDAILFKLRWC